MGWLCRAAARPTPSELTGAPTLCLSTTARPRCPCLGEQSGGLPHVLRSLRTTHARLLGPPHHIESARRHRSSQHSFLLGDPLRNCGQVLVAFSDPQQGCTNLRVRRLRYSGTRFLGLSPPAGDGFHALRHCGVSSPISV